MASSSIKKIAGNFYKLIICYDDMTSDYLTAKENAENAQVKIFSIINNNRSKKASCLSCESSHEEPLNSHLLSLINFAGRQQMHRIFS